MEEEHIIRKIALVHKIVVHKFVYFNFFVYIYVRGQSLDIQPEPL